MSKEEAMKNMVTFMNIKDQEALADERRLDEKAANLKKRSAELDRQYKALQDRWEAIPGHLCNGEETLQQIAEQYGITNRQLARVNKAYEDEQKYPSWYKPHKGDSVYLPIEGVRSYQKVMASISQMYTEAAGAKDKADKEAKTITDQVRAVVVIIRKEAHSNAQRIIDEATTMAQRIIDEATTMAQAIKKEAHAEVLLDAQFYPEGGCSYVWSGVDFAAKDPNGK